MIQNNLGTALSEQGIRTGGEAGARLLAEAVEAYRAVLEVRTRNALPQQWAETQSNLAETYYALEDWINAKECYVNVLKLYPRDETAYQHVGFILHEYLFQFERAYNWYFIWVNDMGNDDLLSLSNLVENNFTTGRFGNAEVLLSQILPDIKPDDDLYGLLNAIEILILIAQNKIDIVQSKLKSFAAFVKKQPENYSIEWTFDGTKHFISNNNKLSAHKDLMLSFIVAVEAKNRNDMLQGLNAVLKNL